MTELVSCGDMKNRIGNKLIEAKQKIDLDIANHLVDMFNFSLLHNLILASDCNLVHALEVSQNLKLFCDGKIFVLLIL